MNKCKIRVLGTLMMMGTLCSSAAPVNMADTVKKVNNPERVRVIKNGSNTTVEILSGSNGRERMYKYEMTVDSLGKDDEAMQWNLDFPFREAISSQRRVGKTGWSASVFKNLYFGWTFAYSHKGDVKNCFETGIADVVAANYTPWACGPTFSLGIGFGMHRYLARDGMVYRKDGNRVSIVNRNPDWIPDYSRLDIWTFDVPFRIEQSFGKCFAFSVGAILNFNSYAVAATQYRNGEAIVKEKYKGLTQRLVTTDFCVALGVRAVVSVYGKWSPVPAFQSPYGPQMRSFSVGMTLSF